MASRKRRLQFGEAGGGKKKKKLDVAAIRERNRLQDLEAAQGGEGGEDEGSALSSLVAGYADAVEAPAEVVDPAVRSEVSAVAVWQKTVDESSGSVYYWNPATQEVSWTLPVGATVEEKATGDSGSEEAAMDAESALTEGGTDIAVKENAEVDEGVAVAADVEEDCSVGIEEEVMGPAPPPALEDMPPGLECEEEVALLLRRVERELMDGLEQVGAATLQAEEGESVLGQPLILTDSLLPAKDFLQLVKDALDTIQTELGVRKMDWEQGGLLVPYFRDRLAEGIENLKYYRAEVEKVKLDILFLTSSTEEAVPESAPGMEILVQKPPRRIAYAEPDVLPEETSQTVKKKGPERVVTSSTSSVKQMLPMVAKWKRVEETLEQNERTDVTSEELEQRRHERWRIRQLQLFVLPLCNSSLLEPWKRIEAESLHRLLRCYTLFYTSLLLL